LQFTSIGIDCATYPSAVILTEYSPFIESVNSAVPLVSVYLGWSTGVIEGPDRELVRIRVTRAPSTSWFVILSLTMTGRVTDCAVSGSHLGWSSARVRVVSQLQLFTGLQSIVLLPPAVM